jgi:hypothetical protein
LHAQFGGAFVLLAHETETHRAPGGAVQQFVYCLCSDALSAGAGQGVITPPLQSSCGSA